MAANRPRALSDSNGLPVLSLCPTRQLFRFGRRFTQVADHAGILEILSSRDALRHLPNS